MWTWLISPDYRSGSRTLESAFRRSGVWALIVLHTAEASCASEKPRGLPTRRRRFRPQLTIGTGFVKQEKPKKRRAGCGLRSPRGLCRIAHGRLVRSLEVLRPEVVGA